MAGGLAAHQPAALLQLFEHITVADFGAGERDVFFLQGQLHRHIGHDRADHAAQRQPFLRAGFGDNVDEFVAVVDAAVFVGHQQAVAVAVEGDAVVGFVLQNGGLQVFRIGCAAALVDVVAVGFVGDAHHFRAQLVEHFRRDAVARAVGTVYHQFQAAQVEMVGEGGFAELDVAVVGAVDAAGAAEAVGMLGLRRFVQFGLDFQLDFVGQLDAAFSKKLDAVVGIAVVRGGNHHARRQPQRARQIGDAGRGQWAGLDYVHARRGEARHQRRFQHIAGNARVLADNYRRPALAVVFYQHAPGGIAQFQHEIGGNRKFAHLAAHAVGAEIFFSHDSAPFTE